MSYWDFLRFLAWMMFTAFMALLNSSHIKTSNFAKIFTWFLFLIGALAMLALLIANTLYAFL